MTTANQLRHVTIPLIFPICSRSHSLPLCALTTSPAAADIVELKGGGLHANGLPPPSHSPPMYDYIRAQRQQSIRPSPPKSLLGKGGSHSLEAEEEKRSARLETCGGGGGEVSNLLLLFHVRRQLVPARGGARWVTIGGGGRENENGLKIQGS